MILLEKPTPSSPHLHFEPEIHRRKQISGIKFLIGCFLAFAATAATIGLITIANQTFQLVSFSHRYLYQNQTLDAVTNRSLVVQPLIDDDQTFDLVVTIWHQPPPEEMHAKFAASLAKSNRKTAEAASVSLANTTTTAVIREVTISDEESFSIDSFAIPVFSDTVFKGLRLRDQHLFAEVNFSIPTEIFTGEWVHQYGAQASIMLMPTSPSLLDYVDSVSTTPGWGMQLGRSNPFPMGSNTTKYNETTPIEIALRSMGVQVPLVQLLEIPSTCETSADQFESSDSVDDSVFDDKDDWRGSMINGHYRRNHPFLVTRFHLIAVEETHLFNRKAFDAARNRLKKMKSNCFGPGCRRNYHDDGNLDLLLKLGIPKGTGNRTEYAYGPYLSYVPIAGPLDLVQVPVNRENCSAVPSHVPPNTTTSQSEQPERMDITLKLSYSGRSSSKVVLSETLQYSSHEFFYRYTWDPNAGDYQRSAHHDVLEMISGVIHNNKASEDSHPRRKLIFSVLLILISGVTWLLDLHYWFTCTSTNTISVPGNVMISLASLTDTAFNFVAVVHPGGFVPWTWLLLKNVVSQTLKPALVLKAAMRLDFRWDKMLPHLKRLPSSPLERRSERVDAKTPWIIRGGIFILLALGYWFFTPEELYLIEPTAPTPTSAELPKLGYNTRMFISSLHWTGLISQMTLNQRLGVFSGSYRTAIMLHVLGDFISLLFHFPSVMGRVQFHWGIPAHWIFGMIIKVLFAFQALVYPPHIIADEEPDTE